MLSNHNHKEERCDFADQLVSYLYDEIAPAARPTFENHLQRCASCADELAAFAGVRFAIDEWKAAEFSPLDASLPAMPFKNEAETDQLPVPAPVASWIDSLRGLFSPGSGLVTAGAAAVVLLMLAGLVFVAYNAGRDVRLADKDNKKPALTPTAAPTTAKTNVEVADERGAKPDEVTENAPDAPDTSAPAPKTGPDKPVKISDATRPPAKPDAAKTSPKNKNPKSDKTNNSRRKAPNLSPYGDDEDDSLRLTDLFAEIGTD